MSMGIKILPFKDPMSWHNGLNTLDIFSEPLMALHGTIKKEKALANVKGVGFAVEYDAPDPGRPAAFAAVATTDEVASEDRFFSLLQPYYRRSGPKLPDVSLPHKLKEKYWLVYADRKITRDNR